MTMTAQIPSVAPMLVAAGWSRGARCWHFLRENDLTVCGALPPTATRQSRLDCSIVEAARDGFRPCQRCVSLFPSVVDPHRHCGTMRAHEGHPWRALRRAYWCGGSRFGGQGDR